MAQKTHRRWMYVMAGMLAAGGVAAGVRGQGAPQLDGATQVGGAPDPSRLLDSVRKDDEAGYRLAPPAGSTVIYRGGVDLMSFVVKPKSWGGTLSKVVVQKEMTLDDYVAESTNALQKQFKAVQVLESRSLRFSGYPAQRVSLSMEDSGPAQPKNGQRGAAAPGPTVAAYRQELIVQLDKKNEFMVLTFYSLLRDKEAATQVFDAMLGSYELVDPVKIRERHLEAAAVAKKWLAEVSAEKFKNKINNQKRYFKMLLDGTEMGWIEFSEMEAVHDGYKGLQLLTYSYTFPEGKLVRGENLAFWAYNHNDKGEPLADYSMWDNISKRKANVANPKTRVVETKDFWLEESGTLSVNAGSLLTDDQLKQMELERNRQITEHPERPLPPPLPNNKRQVHLEVHLGGDPSQHMNQQGLNLDLPPEAPAFLPKFLEYTWTRMVLLSKPTEMSFWSFNPTKKTLDLRTLTITGKKDRIQAGGKSQECWKCIDEMDPGSTTLWVDSDGQLVKLQTSDGTTLVPTTEQEMQTRWAAKLAGQ